MTVLAVLAVVAAAFLFSEVYGYWLHVLMHDNRVEFLSRNHMIHHLVVYGPRMPQQTAGPYVASVQGRLHLGTIGVEWLLPGGAAALGLLALFHALSLRPFLQLVFIVSAITWSLAALSAMHDAMHVKGFWMERSPALGGWFAGLRRRHILHHTQLDDEGRMCVDYGICFFFCDRLFGTLRREPLPFNHKGYEAALERYAFIFPRS
ncbi:MAG: sterol desaturase family protein [Elusimicrobia bacterium]|nr:sterol desaturase family protein [Elusimicrobiota bacterium]